jgi:hypothetical protein
VRMVVTTTMIVILVVAMGVLRILMSGHRFSSVLPFPAWQAAGDGAGTQRRPSSNGHRKTVARL